MAITIYYLYGPGLTLLHVHSLPYRSSSNLFLSNWQILFLTRRKVGWSHNPVVQINYQTGDTPTFNSGFGLTNSSFSGALQLSRRYTTPVSQLLLLRALPLPRRCSTTPVSQLLLLRALPMSRRCNTTPVSQSSFSGLCHCAEDAPRRLANSSLCSCLEDITYMLCDALLKMWMRHRRTCHLDGKPDPIRQDFGS